MTKSDDVIIAHISDLHYEDISHWEYSFKQLERSLLSQLPDVIVNTGDLLHTPALLDYPKLSHRLNDLCNKIEEKKKDKVYLVSVPGNHDCFFFGWMPYKPLVYETYIKSLQYPRDLGLEEVVKRIFYRKGIALYPFDSNELRIFRDFLGLAQGRIEDPDEIFDRYNGLFGGKEPLTRIALLHHHPLPMAVPATEEITEPFLVLRRAHAFLLASLSNKIDLILHGHMHRLGACEYRSFLSEVTDKPIRILGCASSGKVSERKKEYVIHKVGKAGNVTSRVYSLEPTQNSYVKGPSVQIIPYKDARKHKNKNMASNPNILVQSARKKSKVVKISDKGDAVIDIFYDNIHIKPHSVGNEELMISERATADVGRIPTYYTYFGTEVPRPDKNDFFSKLPANKIDQPYNILPEMVTIDLREGYCDSSQKYHSQIRYLMLGGYCLTTYQHKWLYQDIGLTRCSEFCYASIDFQVDVLEIDVKFPDKFEFPDPKSIKLLAVRKDSVSYDTDGYCFLGEQYKMSRVETDFLIEKNALSIRPSTFEVNVRIRYPQPDLIYIIRWDLPTEIQSEISRRQCDSFRSLLATGTNTATNFWNSVDKIARNNLINVDFDLVLLAITPDDESRVKVFKAVAGPPEYLGKKFFVTRGVAGRAFRYGQVRAYVVSDSAEQCIERLHEGYDPALAISIPVILRVDKVSTQIEDSEEFHPESEVVCVFSLVFKNYHDFSNSTTLDIIASEIQASFQKHVIISDARKAGTKNE
jgi:predicted MPP superfamily phosphohydrolase